MKLFMLLLFCHVSSPVKHSLNIFLTASSGVSDFPEVVAVMLINDVEVGYCDSKIKTAIGKQDWMDELRDGDPDFWKWYTSDCTLHQQLFKDEFHNVKKRLNQTGDLPSVSLLQKTPSSPVTCHATGFYPDRAMMFWSKDGEELHEGVEHGEILPNGDGTFQMSVSLNLSTISPEDQKRCECVFHLSGVEDDVVTRLADTEIMTNSVKSALAVGSIAAVSAVLLIGVIVTAACGVYRYRQRTAKPAKSETADEPEVSVSLTAENPERPRDEQ